MRPWLAALTVLWAGTPAAHAAGSMLSSIPQSATAAVVLQRAAVEDLRRQLQSTPAIRRETTRRLRSLFGVGLEDIGAMALVIGGDARAPELAAVLEVKRTPTFKGGRSDTYKGDRLLRFSRVSAAVTGERLVVGNRAGVQRVLDRVRGRGPTIGRSAPLGKLLEMQTKNTHALVGLTAAAAWLLPERMLRGLKKKVRALWLSYHEDGTLRWRLGCMPGKAPKVKEELEEETSDMARRFRWITRRGVQGLDEVLPSMIMFHNLAAVVRRLRPQVSGDALVGRAKLPKRSMVEMAAVGAAARGLGLLARHVAKRGERMTNRMSELAQKAHQTAKAHAKAHEGPGDQYTFPASTPWSSPRCCEGVLPVRCTVTPETLRHPTWRELQIPVAKPVRFQYRFISEGKGKSARYRIEARADMDCDGDYHTYTSEGHLTKGSSGGRIQSEGE